MPEINIPENLNNRLSLNSTWQRVVTMLKEKVQTLIKEGPYFFPDYTDHGIDHINAVLNMADQLISKETYTTKQSGQYLLDSKAVAFLICAILLHDLGMFLKPDGAQELADGAHSSHLVKKLDRNTWKESWSKYVSRTQRLKISEMVRTYGHSVEISEDCIRKGFSTTEDDRRIIGEFLRQNHGRLAHEIAIHGFPGTQSQDLFHEPDCNKKDRDMIGLLARSHQMNIRDTEAYVRTFGKDSMPHGIPAYYLMAVLRMADYLDASEKRAPEILERIQKIRVPSSEQEWTWNQCISKDEKRCDPFTHNLRIDADPEKSTDYVLVDQWLRSVQAELDLCWSILAEHYSDKPFRLTIHRVISRIHEEDVLERFNEEFLTREVKITANPEIVKLMMEPLYGDDPTYGVRELLQNAVDACLEREQWEKTHKEGDPNYKGLVDIRIENGVFTITDNGMGMNEDVLLNYYLSAGSSYRSSDAWMAANAPDGKSQVARTGKFGVGFLAAFLLGNEVEVLTQHREDEKGYHFTFSQEAMPLDVERMERSEPGTTITIRLKPTAIKNWNSDPNWHNWYAFDDPVVSYTIDGYPVQHQNLRLHRTPTEDDGWLILPSDDFEAYHLKPNLISKKPEFYCNGIRIYHEFPDSMVGSKPQIYYPHISILDKQGKLAVDLARKKLEEIPLKETLLREVLRWHIARLLLTPWNSEEDHRQNLILGFTFRADERYGHLPFLLAPGGFQLNHASLLRSFSVRDYVVLYHEGPDARDARLSARNFLLEDKPCTIVAADVYKQQPSDDYVVRKLYYYTPSAFTNDFLKNDTGLLDSWSIDYSVHDHTRSLWFRPDVPDKLDEILRERITLDEPSTTDHLLTGCWEGRTSDIPIDPERFPAEQFPAAFHVVPDLHGYDFSMWDVPLFVELMQELLTPEPGWPQDLWIPYDMEERKQKFRSAFQELSNYIEHIQKEPEREVRREAAQMARRRAETMAQLPRIQAKLESKAAIDDKFAADLLQRIAELQPKAASGNEVAADRLSTVVELSKLFLL